MASNLSDNPPKRIGEKLAPMLLLDILSSYFAPKSYTTQNIENSNIGSPRLGGPPFKNHTTQILSDQCMLCTGDPS